MDMKVYKVSEFVSAVHEYLEEGLGTVSVQGEVSGFRTAQEKLVYFELKDAESRVLCFMLKWQLKTLLEDGMEIRVHGRASLFKKTGGFHIRVQDIELVGAGALNKALQMLKQKLEGEGLFSVKRKRALPNFPETIGLITSPDAAAYTDVLRVMKNRWGGARVRFIPCGVQGPGAIQQLVSAFKHFNTQERVEVIILTRGGGSLEDLQAFNSEDLARAIFSSRSPVVCGVGHERDWTIADLVADVRASTPSNAAERVVPDRREVLFQIDTLTLQVEDHLREHIDSMHYRTDSALQTLERGIRQRSEALHQVLAQFHHAAAGFRHNIASLRLELSTLTLVLNDRVKFSTHNAFQRLQSLLKLISSLSPQATLRRGYSVTYGESGIITAADQVTEGEHLRTRLSRGSVKSRVTSS